MQENIKLSVIIPVYNVELYLEECLDSVIHQTLKEIEILCINDGSTDSSLSILEKYAVEDKRIKIITQENKGLSEARNTGISNATGEYIYFLDSDDYISLNALFMLYQKGKEDNLDILFFSTIPFFEEKMESREVCHKGVIRNSSLCYIENGRIMFETMVQTNQFESAAWLYITKKSHIQKNNLRFYPKIYHEDNLFTFQNLLLAERTSSISDVFYHRRIRENSIMTIEKSQKHIEGYVTCYAEMLLFYRLLNILDRQNLYRNFFEKFRKIVASLYFEVHQTDSFKVEETLANLENLLLGSPLHTFYSLDIFSAVRDNYKELIFFGAGEQGESTISMFKKYNITPPVAICDNGKEKHGSQLGGGMVISWEDLKERYQNPKFIITNINYFFEIKNQILEKYSDMSILRIGF